MRKIVIGLAAIAALIATPALAADIAVKAPPPPAGSPAFSWTGFYIGADAGAEWTKSSFTTLIGPGTGFFDSDSLTFIDAIGTGSATKSGFIGGGQLGYNWQADKLVLGVEGDFDGMAGKATLNAAGRTPGGSAVTLSNTLTPHWLGTFRPRLGYAAGQLLVYVTGGLAVLHSNYTQTFTNVTGPFTGGGSSTASATKAAGIVGGGVEYALTKDWSVKAEYLYAKFGGISAAGSVFPGAGNFDPLSGTASQTIQIARGGINYHF